MRGSILPHVVLLACIFTAHLGAASRRGGPQQQQQGLRRASSGRGANANGGAERSEKKGPLRPSTSLYCSRPGGQCRHEPGEGEVSYKITSVDSRDLLCRDGSSRCGPHAFCYMGRCLCHPGFAGRLCDKRIAVSAANPWYTDVCPNLSNNITFDFDTPLAMVGGEKSSDAPCPSPTKNGFCSYLCYSHRAYGVAVVPKSLWLSAQASESSLWRSLGGTENNDRVAEHIHAYDSYRCLQPTSGAQASNSLGRVIEVGAGPWTQVKGLLHGRPDLTIDELTIWEPGADGYMQNVQSCSYKTGKLRRFDNKGFHDFPVVVNSKGGELLDVSKAVSREQQYDVVISINVVEHVQNAFQYLMGLYGTLRPGGTLIFHERYYNSDEEVLNGDEYHPVRVKQLVFDLLLDPKLFRIVFNNCSATYDGRPGERGYYIIAIKL